MDAKEDANQNGKYKKRKNLDEADTEGRSKKLPAKPAGIVFILILK